MALDSARKDGRSGISLAKLADREARKADHLDARPAFDKTDAFHKRIEAGWVRGEAARLLDALPPTLVGSPETIANRASEMLERAQPDALIGMFSFGGLTHQQVTHSIELFASRVIPALKARALTPA